MMKLQIYTVQNYRSIKHVSLLRPEQLEAIEVISQVLPFKTNSYVTEQLINWEDPDRDPMFKLTFPQAGMLSETHYGLMRNACLSRDRARIKRVADYIRMSLNPHPAGQLEHNVPELYGTKLSGLQHKYRETVLFFPSQGQTCHAYCSFCFRWPQFVGINGLKFAEKDGHVLKDYLERHPEVSDLLLTGGDPMIMKSKVLESYLDPLLKSRKHKLSTIRIGSKALAYWPYRFTHDEDAADLFALFKRIREHGIHLSFMAHVSHPVELSTQAAKDAIARLREAGIQIRTQSPVLRHINDNPQIWAEMWKQQVQLGCIPYYMFIPRDTGAKDYFSIPLEHAWQIFRKAYKQVSGICRTVRGPSMSCHPGKIQVLGVAEILAKRYFVLRMLQGRNPDWVGRPFFAEYNEKAVWFDDLEPAFGEEKFFFEQEDYLRAIGLKPQEATA